jgi:hypothetical protein
MGDMHVRKDNCMGKSSIPVTRFIESVLKRNPKSTIDLFLEMETVHPKKAKRLFHVETDGIPADRKKTDWLGTMMLHFDKCLSLRKNSCPFPNLRAHYADVRFRTRVLGSLVVELVRLFGKTTAEQREYVRLHEKGFRQMISINHSPQRILSETKVLKQILAVRNPVIREKIHAFTVAQMKKFHVQSFEQLVKSPDQIGGKLLHFFGTVMDAYTLGRMFRSYSSVKTPKGLGLSSAKNMIVYVGDWHADNYRKFLRSIGFATRTTVRHKIPDQTTTKRLVPKTMFQCQPMAKFKAPIFPVDSLHTDPIRPKKRATPIVKKKLSTAPIKRKRVLATKPRKPAAVRRPKAKR